MRGKKYQARLCYVPTDCKAKEQRHIGSFDTCEEAVAALAEAQHKRKKENRTQKERKKENRQPKRGMGGRHAATTQGF